MGQNKSKPVPPGSPDPDKGYWGGHAPTPDGEPPATPPVEPVDAEPGEDPAPAQP